MYEILLHHFIVRIERWKDAFFYRIRFRFRSSPVSVFHFIEARTLVTVFLVCSSKLIVFFYTCDSCTCFVIKQNKLEPFTSFEWRILVSKSSVFSTINFHRLFYSDIHDFSFWNYYLHVDMVDIQSVLRSMGSRSDRTNWTFNDDNYKLSFAVSTMDQRFQLKTWLNFFLFDFLIWKG